MRSRLSSGLQTRGAWQSTRGSLFTRANSVAPHRQITTTTSGLIQKVHNQRKFTSISIRTIRKARGPLENTWYHKTSKTQFQLQYQSHLHTMSLPEISLTPSEQLFRSCLLNCRAAMIDTPGMKDLELRFTGGWVRDKLLGTTSHDIDVALSTMTGLQFGQALQEYMKENAAQYEEKAKQGGFKAEIKSLHKIAANPEKSKHLETITTRMFGIDVDFVNLRKEVYDEKSRNPQMEFGTPEEDAMRRDACVNALFYNLDTQQVEDFTKRGLEDMKTKVLRTPLEPYQTFKDDPLRVLRLIRFAARLGYSIEDESRKAMADPTIHDALRLKISRERVGVEVMKIIEGPDPFGGLSQLYNSNLYTTVFADPEDKSANRIAEEDFPTALDSLRSVLQDCSSICLVLKPKQDLDIIWTLAAYVPYRADEIAAVDAAKAGIKSTNKVSKVLGGAVAKRQQLHNLVKRVVDGSASVSNVGMVLRENGKSWRYHVLYSLLCDCVDESFSDISERYSKFVQFVQSHNLEGAAELKPILDGNQIKKALGITKAGSWLKDALDVVVAWQFAHPDGTADEAQDMIRSKNGQFPIG